MWRTWHHGCMALHGMAGDKKTTQGCVKEGLDTCLQCTYHTRLQYCSSLLYARHRNPTTRYAHRVPPMSHSTRVGMLVWAIRRHAGLDIRPWILFRTCIWMRSRTVGAHPGNPSQTGHFHIACSQSGRTPIIIRAPDRYSFTYSCHLVTASSSSTGEHVHEAEVTGGRVSSGKQPSRLVPFVSFLTICMYFCATH